MSSRTRPGPAATRTGGRRADRLARAGGCALLLVAALASAACSWMGVLTDEEEKLLDTHKRNSKAYYEVGDYVRAEDQCRKGLAIDDDDETLKLTLGYALLMQAQPKSLAEARDIFGAEIGAFGTKDWRLQMGYRSEEHTSE